MGWVVNVGCVRERRNVYRGNVKIRGNLEDLDGHRRIILKMDYFHCYTVHVVELFSYYTNYCTYIKLIKSTH